MTCRGSAIRRLVLASGSPRRKQLLSLLGLPFVIQAANVDEEPHDGEPPDQMVLRVARAKAQAVVGIRPDELVIAADTTVAVDGRSLGKPADGADAVRMLQVLRARQHVVYTGMAVLHPATHRLVAELGKSSILMRDYADGEVQRYVESGDPLDKAGAYAIQHPVFDPVAQVDGCWLNVMGLPLCHLARALVAAGLAAPAAHVPASCRAFTQRACTAWPEVLAGLPSDGSRL